MPTEASKAWTAEIPTCFPHGFQGPADGKLVFLSSAGEVAFELDGRELYSERIAPGSPAASVRSICPKIMQVSRSLCGTAFGNGRRIYDAGPLYNLRMDRGRPGVCICQLLWDTRGIYGCVLWPRAACFCLACLCEKRISASSCSRLPRWPMLFCRMTEGMGIIFLPEGMVSVFHHPF